MEIAKLHGKDGNIQQFIIGKSAEKLSSFQFGNFIFRDRYSTWDAVSNAP
jgi:hypothetical protein